MVTEPPKLAKAVMADTTEVEESMRGAIRQIRQIRQYCELRSTRVGQIDPLLWAVTKQAFETQVAW